MALLSFEGLANGGLVTVLVVEAWMVLVETVMNIETRVVVVDP